MPKPQAKFLFDQGIDLFHKQRVDEATRLFKEAILEDPQYPEALYNLACCYALLGEREEALLYLDRAIKLDLSCLDWAKEDEEFDSLRDDETFIKILEVNDPFRPAIMGEDEQAVGLAGEAEVSESGGPSEGTATDEPPPCAQCGALIEEMRLPRYDPVVSVVVIATGVGLTLALASLQYIHALIFGIPLTAFGLWMFTRIEDTWVCQNCGARGEAAGQPPRQPKTPYSADQPA